jgi:hypothetical protein
MSIEPGLEFREIKRDEFGNLLPDSVDHVMRPDIRAVTDDEQRAIAEIHKSLDASLARITQPQQLALTLTQEATPEASLLDKALAVERAKVDAEISRLMQKPETESREK